MVVLSLFDGISCGRIALERVGIKVDKYFASEIDKHAIKVSSYNYPDIVQIGNVENVRFENGTLFTEKGSFDVGKIDLVIAGSPCQGFSLAGEGLAFDDPRSKLYFEFERIKNEVNPVHWLLENVKMKKEHKDVITSRLGISPVMINSSLVSAQNRERLYWSSAGITLPTDKGVTLQDIVPSAEGVYTLPRGYNKGGTRETNKCPCITTSSWQHNFFWVDWLGVRYKFTPEMCEEFQTLPLGYTRAVSDNQRYKLLGNGWTVDVIVHIFKSMFVALYRRKDGEVA